MTWIFLIFMAVFAVLSFWGGRKLAVRRSQGVKPHSRPGQHGLYAAIGVLAPALAVMILAAVFSAPIERQLIAAGAPEAVSQLEPFRREAFIADARRVGQGGEALQIWAAPYAELLPTEGRRAHSIHATLSWGGMTAAVIAAILGALFVAFRIRPELRARNAVEGWVVGVLFACATVAVLTTVGIIFSLVYDSLRFFSMVDRKSVV